MADNLRLLQKVIVRQAMADDLVRMEWDGALLHYRRLFLDAYQASQKGSGQIWIAELRAGELVGQLLLALSSGCYSFSDGIWRAYLYGFRVRPEYRGQGVGSLMIRTVEKHLYENHYGVIMLNVAKDNPHALRLYERHGYRVVASEPGNWFYIDHEGFRREVHEPAWKMEKALFTS